MERMSVWEGCWYWGDVGIVRMFVQEGCWYGKDVGIK